jgi:hypothetical protein
MIFGLDPRTPRATTRATATRLPPVLDHIPWTKFLVWLMRSLSLLWLIKGLTNWATILGLGVMGSGGFEKLSLMQQTTTGFFAVIDVIAGVGLWMGSGWGAAVWLMATAAHLAIGYIVPRALAMTEFTALFFGGLIIVLLFSTWAALRQSASAPATRT